MTRINLVPVGELTDQHLFAEYREIKMIPKSLARSLNAAWKREFAKNNSTETTVGIERVRRSIESVRSKIPKEFTLGTGHVSFFYDKGAYLTQRYQELIRELVDRDYNFKPSIFDPDKVMQAPEWWNGDPIYKPSPHALALIRARISEKIALKPHWYKYHGKALGPKHTPP